MRALLLLLSRDVSDSPGFQAFAFSIIHGAVIGAAAMLGFAMHERIDGIPWGAPGSLRLSMAFSAALPAWCVSAWLCLRTARDVYGTPLTSVFLTCLLGGWVLGALLFMVSERLVLREFIHIAMSTARAGGGSSADMIAELAPKIRVLVFVTIGHYAAACTLLSYPLVWYKLGSRRG